MSTGTAELLADLDAPGGWLVVVNGVASSYVHLDDPTLLDFEYMRWIGDLLDLVRPPSSPLRVAHLGGAGCTLARYVAATRPGSRQVVVEHDAELVRMARDTFGLRGARGIRMSIADARAALSAMHPASQDVVIRDAFTGDRVPRHLTTSQFLADVRRVLEPAGVYVANIADAGQLDLARDEAATALATFRRVILVAEPAQLRGRRFGNVVLAASDGPLPPRGLTGRLASAAIRARLVTTARTRELAAGRSPLVDPPAS